jgi:hypothetical protein
MALAATAFAATAAEAKGASCGSGKTTVVTAKATKDKPLSVSVATQPGLGTTSPNGASGDNGQVTHAYTNVLVKGTGKLFVRAEFLQFEDYDLYLHLGDSPAIAYAAGFNPGGPVNDVLMQTPAAPSKGGHSEIGAEQIDGAAVKGCAVVDLASATTPGGAVTLKLWLG